MQKSGGQAVAQSAASADSDAVQGCPWRAEVSMQARTVRSSDPSDFCFVWLTLCCRVGEGMPLFGKSSNYPAAKPDSRIDFQFDTAAFYFSFLPFPIPYPVPFRILGDERKVSVGLMLCFSSGVQQVRAVNQWLNASCTPLPSRNHSGQCQHRN